MFKLLLLILLCSWTTSYQGSKHLVGILTLDHPQIKDKTTYFPASYSKWLEQTGLRWIPINMYLRDQELAKTLDLVQGVLLTGGD